MARPLALTSGEPAGIGPDITINAWLRRNELQLPAFYFLGDCDFLSQRAKALGLKVELAEVRPEDALGAFAEPDCKQIPPEQGYRPRALGATVRTRTFGNGGRSVFFIASRAAFRRGEGS